MVSVRLKLLAMTTLLATDWLVERGGLGRIACSSVPGPEGGGVRVARAARSCSSTAGVELVPIEITIVVLKLLTICMFTVAAAGSGGLGRIVCTVPGGGEA